MSLTVACVWVKGHVPFTAEYVIRLERMVRTWVDRPYRFVCLTDQPQALPAIQTIACQAPKGQFAWWAKVQLFQPGLFSGRVLYLDLDTLIVAPLAPIVDYPAPFALVPHAGDFNGKFGLQVVKRFNSSVMVWDAGTQDHIATNWTPKAAERLWGDQDHIGEQCPDAAAMPADWFPRLSEVDGPPFGAAKVILAKKPKNEIAAKKWLWFRERWG